MRSDATPCDEFVKQACCLLRQRLDKLKQACVRRVTFLVQRAGEDGEDDEASGPPAIYTFRAKTDFAEDVLFRHIEPPHAFHLDLVRLTNFSIRIAETQQTLLSNVHCYEVSPKTHVRAHSSASTKKNLSSSSSSSSSSSTAHTPGTTNASPSKDVRFFVRNLYLAPDFASPDVERMLVESLARAQRHRKTFRMKIPFLREWVKQVSGEHDGERVL